MKILQQINKKTPKKFQQTYVLQTCLLFCMLTAASVLFLSWGFAAHRKIIDVTIHFVSEPLHGFFKANRDWLVEHALDADLRKHSVIGEAEKHYIDLEAFGVSQEQEICLPPFDWNDAVGTFGEDELRSNGIGPWNVQWQYRKLTVAFASQDKTKILRCAADLAHYIADLHVPLHTTENYDGAITGQKGIHSLWETQVPELRMAEFDLVSYSSALNYLPLCTDSIWDIISESHGCLPLVFSAEKEAMEEIGEHDSFAFVVRGRTRQKMRTEAFVSLYHAKLNGQVEQRMRSSIEVCALFWYCAWVQAGQPTLPLNTNDQNSFRRIFKWLIN